jgi:hypothetical protein
LRFGRFGVADDDEVVAATEETFVAAEGERSLK